MNKQINLFLLALSFFSRLPVSGWVQYSSDNLNQANRYFGMVGWLLGAIVAAAFWLLLQYFSQAISVFLAMIVSLLLTGVFHEDGLADMADGFGGGFDPSRKLEIMKDSRLGTYGSAALMMALLGKFLFLSESGNVLLAILVAYPLSRAVAGSFIFDMDYVRESVNGSEQSKSKPLASQQTSTELMILLLSGAATFMLLPLNTVFWLLAVLSVFRVAFKRLLLKQIGGFTGDCLGGAQQLSELLIYATLLAVTS
ncbi:MAG: adenosylcobinamide-GDP ribazoletransferase [Algicola sp.]|nr:adenosylcobinamide-GDP ribazoletransferase [Algicola sp.]